MEYYANSYHATICYFLELDPIGLETGNDINRRDALEILLTELNRDHDLHDIMIKVSALDEVLKCQFRLKINTIMNECSFIEDENYPESFWWRHPSKILHEVGESRKKILHGVNIYRFVTKNRYNILMKQTDPISIEIESVISFLFIYT